MEKLSEDERKNKVIDYLVNYNSFEVIDYLENLCKDVEAELYIEKAKAVIMFNYDNAFKIDELIKKKLMLETAIDILKK